MIHCQSANSHGRVQFGPENAMLAAIVDSSDDAIISKTLDGIITTWNAAAERIFGYTSDEAIDRSIRMLLPHDRAGEETDILTKLRRGERVMHFETVRVTKSGREIDVSITSSPVRDRRGNIIGASKIVRDISGQKRATEAMRAQQTALEHLNRLHTMGEMAVGLAHELTQPLASILNYAGVSLDGVRSDKAPAKETIAAALQEVVNETLRAREIIRRLRDFISKRQRDREPVDLNALVKDSVHLLQHDLRRAEISVSLLLDEDAPAVMGDPIQLVQVLVNLLRNARDAMLDPAAASRKLTIATSCCGGEARVDVTDRGCGLTDDQMARLFDRFFTTKPTGLGMGLAISRTIVNSHGGKLTAAVNHNGGGMTFRLTLPVKALRGS